MEDKDLKGMIEGATADARRHFDVVAERLDRKIETIAEAVGSLGGELRGELDEQRQEIRRGFADTQAMIKFSHAELDRRVRVLEEAVSSLHARIERLEATIH